MGEVVRTVGFKVYETKRTEKNASIVTEAPEQRFCHPNRRPSRLVDCIRYGNNCGGVT